MKGLGDVAIATPAQLPTREKTGHRFFKNFLPRPDRRWETPATASAGELRRGESLSPIFLDLSYSIG